MHYTPAIREGDLSSIAERQFVDSGLVQKRVRESDLLKGATVSHIVRSCPNAES